MSEKVYSLKKEVTKRKSLTKLKLDLSKNSWKVFDKIANYFGKELNELELEMMHPDEYMIFNNFKVEAEITSEYTEEKLNKFFSKEKSIEATYKFSVYNSKGKPIIFYSIPGVKINDSTRRYYYRNMIKDSKENIRVIDTNFAYGVLKAIDESIEFIKHNKDLYKSEQFSKISVFNKCYDESQLNSLHDIESVANFVHVAPLAEKIIIDTVIIMQNFDLNIELTEWTIPNLIDT